MKNYKDRQTIIPYLMLENASAFINFAQAVFSAEVAVLNMDEENTKVLYAEIVIGHTAFLLAESADKYGKAVGNFFIYVQDADDTFKRAVFHSAAVVKEISDMDHGRCGGIEDPFGNTWWITTA